MSAGTSEVLKRAGVEAFGVGMPVLSTGWSSDGEPRISDDDPLALDLGSGTWLAPVRSFARACTAERPLDVTLLNAAGDPLARPGVLLTLHPQAYTRLARLYVRVLEGSSAAYPARPVPCHFFFDGESALSSDAPFLQCDAGSEIANGGRLSIHDSGGFPIDPVAVAAAFRALGRKHALLWISRSDDPLSGIVALDGAGGPVTRVRVCGPSGAPFADEGNRLTGVESIAVTASAGIWTLGDSRRVAKSPLEGGRVDTLRIGLATTGTLGDSTAVPSATAESALERDFFSLWALDFHPYLLGSRPSDWDVARVEPLPSIRFGDSVRLLADGNDVVGAARQALTGATGEESLVVAQSVDGNFATPTEPGDAAHWPAYPARGPGDPGIPPIRAPAGTAAWIDGDPSGDVLLSLTGLVADAAVRVYPRRFVGDARELRGDGAGGVAGADGTLELVLTDPFELRRRGLDVPTSSELLFDLAIVTRDGTARVIGNQRALVVNRVSRPASQGSGNGFDDAHWRSVCSAGILGAEAPEASFAGLDAVGVVLQLASEGTPRDAPRWPTMARRELLVAARAATGWQGVASAGRLTTEIHAADPRRGAPGGAGGRETQTVGLSTSGGPLAYDLARMALRRASVLPVRLAALRKEVWDEPQNAAGASGPFAAAVLQTVARGCETPELALVRHVGDLHDPAQWPVDWPALVEWLTERLPQGVPFRQQMLTALLPAPTDDAARRVYGETLREIFACLWGRRDAQWSIHDAIGRARRCIYVESPGLGVTSSPPAAGHEDLATHERDLFDALSTRLNDVPGLRVILCSPKYPSYGAGYETFAAHEALERHALISGLATATGAESGDDTSDEGDDRRQGSPRFVGFHPIGFPGRTSSLESLVVIVDDVWALIGSSAFRRRGLTFDGGSDVVLGALELANGVSPAIRELRREIMAARLGIDRTRPGSDGSLPTVGADEARLGDCVESFHVVLDRLAAGGLGRIEPLWNAPAPPESDPGADVRNPDGERFDLATASLTEVLVSLGTKRKAW